jgi:NADPH:quinone reductase-like Zn-dependent oxidoreductase
MHRDLCLHAAVTGNNGYGRLNLSRRGLHQLGPPERLKLQRLPRAPLGLGSVRVKLRAGGINFPDLLVIQGKYQHRTELPFVPGMEAAGLVAKTAPDVHAPVRS